jgi:hypothetical protein
MKSKYEIFDRSRLLLKPLAERHHDYDLGNWLKLEDEVPAYSHPDLAEVAGRIVAAKEKAAARILLMGAHVIKAGMNRYVIDLMEQGFINHVVVNGAGAIHRHMIHQPLFHQVDHVAVHARLDHMRTHDQNSRRAFRFRLHQAAGHRRQVGVRVGGDFLIQPQPVAGFIVMLTLTDRLDQ